MPSNEWITGLLMGLMLGILAPALMMRMWAADSHKRAMATYDRARKLLDFVEGAYTRSPSQKEEG